MFKQTFDGLVSAENINMIGVGLNHLATLLAECGLLRPNLGEEAIRETDLEKETLKRSPRQWACGLIWHGCTLPCGSRHTGKGGNGGFVTHSAQWLDDNIGFLFRKTEQWFRCILHLFYM